MNRDRANELEPRIETVERADVFDQLRDLYVAQCPAGYELQESVDAFYSSEDFWEKFVGWLENAPDLYVASDKAFVESAIRLDGARIVNVGTFYPWAEIEWGGRAQAWVGLDNNRSVLERARALLCEYPGHHVTFVEADITAPLDLGRRFDCVLDLSTFDHLDPCRYETILDNYKRLSDRLVMVYDATREPSVEYDFARYGFNACLAPATMAALLEEVGYTIERHEPFVHEECRSYILARR